MTKWPQGSLCLSKQRQRKKNASGGANALARSNVTPQKHNDGIVHQRRAVINEATNVNEKDLCHFTDEYKRRFVSARRRTLVLGWRCVQIIQSRTRSSSNLQWRAEIYHLADVGAFFFFPLQVQVFRDAVYKCDNDGKQLVPESFSVTSTRFNGNLWINMSDVVRYGLLG